MSILPGGVVHIGHVGVVQLEHTEAAVKGLAGVVGGDFLCGLADALFADFANVLVSRLVCLALFVTGFGQLHHNEFAMPSVLGVQLHHGVGGSSGAGEEVENYFRSRNEHLANHLDVRP